MVGWRWATKAIAPGGEGGWEEGRCQCRKAREMARGAGDDAGGGGGEKVSGGAYSSGRVSRANAAWMDGVPPSFLLRTPGCSFLLDAFGGRGDRPTTDDRRRLRFTIRRCYPTPEKDAPPSVSPYKLSRKDHLDDE